MKDANYDVIVIGGGAAGFFSAIRCAEKNPSLRIAILEKSQNILSKVKVSGGGRCNVTHACFDPKEMVENYPRGKKELLGPFHKFLGGDMMEWLELHGVATKIEDDGRVFPVSDDSETIIDCFSQAIKRLKIKLIKGCSVRKIQPIENKWEVINSDNSLLSQNIIMATGSSPSMWKMLEQVGCKIVSPVPSLFTFNIQHFLIQDLQGVSVSDAEVCIGDKSIATTRGPILITHWGLSGPAILKASSIAAIWMQEKNYRFPISINWTNVEADAVRDHINNQRRANGNRKVIKLPNWDIPKRLWERLITTINLETKNWSDLNNKDQNKLVEILTATKLPVNGKSTFKDEFVTAGGVDTSEINFTTMEHKHFTGLYFAGEVLNIDAVTGGFNFQAAWTTAEVAATSIAQ